MSETIFDKIISKQIPVQIVYEDDEIVAFRDINPQAPVHVLVIPKRKAANLAEFSRFGADIVGAFFSKVVDIARQLGLEGGGYRVVLNHGKQGGQTVEYFHAHILGGRSLQWPPG